MCTDMEDKPTGGTVIIANMDYGRRCWILHGATSGPVPNNQMATCHPLGWMLATPKTAGGQVIRRGPRVVGVVLLREVNRLSMKITMNSRA